MRFINADKLITNIINEGLLGDGYSDSERVDDVINMIKECVQDNIDISDTKQHIYADCHMDDCIHNNSFGDCGLIDGKCLRLEIDFYSPKEKGEINNVN